MSTSINYMTDNCAICLEGVERLSDMVMCTWCRAMLHGSCRETWERHDRQGSGTCPACKQEKSWVALGQALPKPKAKAKPKPKVLADIFAEMRFSVEIATYATKCQNPQWKGGCDKTSCDAKWTWVHLPEADRIPSYKCREHSERDIESIRKNNPNGVTIVELP